MEGNINKKKEPVPQFIPGVRTRAEIISSIVRKRQTREPFDQEELALIEEEREDDRKDDSPRYGH